MFDLVLVHWTVILEDGVLAPGAKLAFRPDLVQRDPAVRRLLFSGAMMDFARRFFGEDVRHFDYIWFRAMSHGNGSKPHCDIVYMGRGTHRLFTAWIPYGEVDMDLGGLMVLEGSHRQGDRLKSYLEMDVDVVCTNLPPSQRSNGWRFDGALSKNPHTLREKLGGRWLTSPLYRPGDVLLFGMGLVHGSIDNRTNRVRLSSDTRYQRASEPADGRWIGENPVGHGPAGKREMIC